METIKYITSLLTFYMKGEVSIDQNFVKFKDPNSILGLIPLGSKKLSVPINQISSVYSNFKIKFGKLIIGIIVVFLAFSMLIDGEGGTFLGFIVLAIIAANIILNAFEVNLVISMTSGKQKSLVFFIFERAKANRVEELINSIVGGRLNDTNTRQQTDRIVDAINNKN